jgi:uncharacterized membrane protein
MATVHSTAYASYEEYLDALSSKIYRTVAQKAIIETKSAKLIALYCLGAMENSSANMTTALDALEELYETTLTAPTLIISGLESEAASAKAVAVTAGENTITFPISLSSADYALFITSYDANGDFLSYKFYDKTTAGFTIEVADDGFIDYRALLV